MMDATQQLPFSFPTLKNSDILRVLVELGIAFTEEELLEPAKHKDAVRNLFIQLVRSTQDVSRNSELHNIVSLERLTGPSLGSLQPEPLPFFARHRLKQDLE